MKGIKHNLKNTAVILAASMTLTLFTACGGSTSKADESKQSADLVLKSGIIQTMVNENDTAQAVAISGNEIVYVGDDAGAEKYVSDKTKVIDLNGQMVTPGFMDGHIHPPANWMNKLYNIDLSNCKTNEEYIKAIKAFVEANPDMPYYEGGPFMLNAYQKEDGSNPGPQKADLDAICPNKAIVINDASHHAIWVNSAALALAGITKETADPDGGLIKRDANGEPTGMLNDAATDLLTGKLPEKNYSDAMIEAALDKFEKEANSYGITGITDIGMPVDQFRAMESKGTLTLRVRAAQFVGPGEKPEDVVTEIKKTTDGDTPLVKGGTVKLFYDGVTEGGTAVFLEPYAEAAGKGDNWYGAPIWNKEEFENMVVAIDKVGLQVHIHAIGDGAVDGSLTAIDAAQKANGARDSRHTITHVCAITDDDIQRMAKLKVVAALQFLWMYKDSYYQLEAGFVGKERADAFYPTKRMEDAGVVLAGASDVPSSSSYNVLEEIEVGVTRNSPYPGEEDTDMHRWAEQGLTAYQMLEAYTKNIAFENFEDKEVGTIEVGKKADLVVLGQNILKCKPTAISDTKVVYTISDGRIVYGE